MMNYHGLKNSHILLNQMIVLIIKADVKQAKEKQQPESLSQNNDSSDEHMDQPEWMEALCIFQSADPRLLCMVF